MGINLEVKPEYQVNSQSVAPVIFSRVKEDSTIDHQIKDRTIEAIQFYKTANNLGYDFDITELVEG